MYIYCRFECLLTTSTIFLKFSLIRTLGILIVVDDHELLYPLQYGNTPLHLAAKGGHTTCMEHLLCTPGLDVNIKNRVRLRYFAV